MLCCVHPNQNDGVICVWEALLAFRWRQQLADWWFSLFSVVYLMLSCVASQWRLFRPIPWYSLSLLGEDSDYTCIWSEVVLFYVLSTMMIKSHPFPEFWWHTFVTESTSHFINVQWNNRLSFWLCRKCRRWNISASPPTVLMLFCISLIVNYSERTWFLVLFSITRYYTNTVVWIRVSIKNRGAS